MVSQYLSGSRGSMQLEHKLSKAHMTTLNQRLRKWFASQKKSQYSSWTFNIVAASLKSDASAKSFIEFLDEEVVRSKTKKHANNTRNIYAGWRGQQVAFVGLIPLPPTEFVNFPANVVSVINFGGDGSDDPFSNDIVDLGDWSEKIAKEVDTAKDPLLKAVSYTHLTLPTNREV